MIATNARPITGNERRALEVLVECGGSMLVSRIPDRNESDVFGNVTPGKIVYNRLERLGLLFFTEEEPLDLPGDPMDGFTFTPEVYITEEGLSTLSAKR